MLSNKLLAISLVAILSGCATNPPGIQTVIQKVEIPIEVPCKQEIPVKPDFKFETLTENDTLFDKSKVLLSDRKLHIGYEVQLLAALNACIK